jgi:hypothetical protein
MRKLKLRMLLPFLQVFLAFGLQKWSVHETYPIKRFDTLYVPTSTMVTNAINAPALFFVALAQPFWRTDHGPPKVLGIGLQELFFYVGIVVVWYLVGRRLDGHASREEKEKERIEWTRVLYCAFLVTMGVVIFWIGALPSLLNSGRFNNPAGNHMAAIFYLAWSVALVLLPLMNLAQDLRRRLANPIA